jgi:hypothetical protein
MVRDRGYELNTSVGKTESVDRHEDSLHTRCLMKCLQENNFRKWRGTS